MHLILHNRSILQHLHSLSLRSATDLHALLPFVQPDFSTASGTEVRLSVLGHELPGESVLGISVL